MNKGESGGSENEFHSQKIHDRNISMMLATQKSRETFEKYRKDTTGRFFTIAGVALALSIAANIVQATRPVPVKYIYADSQGHISPLVALNLPNMKDSDVAVWVSNAISQSFSMDFVRYREQLQNAQQYFTPEGWQAFQQGLQGPHLLSQVTDNHLIMQTVPTQAPELLSARSEGGYFTWRFSIPVVIKFQSSGNQGGGTSAGEYDAVVHVTVTRLPETYQDSALGISRISISTNN